jgi:RsiW-degrading membrane proteinase PrsW (M82 family)
VPTTPAGWYPDPLQYAAWRWWDGRAWTGYIGGSAGQVATRKPRLPRWLSGPVAICLPLVLVGIVIAAFAAPVSVLAAFVPLAIVLPTFSWLDRVEPEPRSSRLHALLWGATVAVTVALIVNTIIGGLLGETVAAVISAPLIEEGMKGLGIVWAVRRREVDGVSDGVVYAGWVALGFAVVEDMTYFALASDQGAFVPTFVIRALLTPFAHPLFTFWTGLAIGLAVRAGKPLFPGVLWGYALAVASHAAWNGGLTLATGSDDEHFGPGLLAAMSVAFFLGFVAVAIALIVLRRREQRRFVAMVLQLAQRYGMPSSEALVFSDWRTLRAYRRTLARPVRKQFDAVHAALARLSLLHQRRGAIDPHDERILATQLDEARRRIDR